VIETETQGLVVHVEGLVVHVESRRALVHVRDNDQNKMRVCVSETVSVAVFYGRNIRCVCICSICVSVCVCV